MATSRQVELIRKLLDELDMREDEALDLVEAENASLLVLPPEDASILIDELILRRRRGND